MEEDATAKNMEDVIKNSRPVTVLGSIFDVIAWGYICSLSINWFLVTFNQHLSTPMYDLLSFGFFLFLLYRNVAQQRRWLEVAGLAFYILTATNLFVLKSSEYWGPMNFLSVIVFIISFPIFFGVVGRFIGILLNCRANDRDRIAGWFLFFAFFVMCFGPLIFLYFILGSAFNHSLGDFMRILPKLGIALSAVVILLILRHYLDKEKIG